MASVSASILSASGHVSKAAFDSVYLAAPLACIMSALNLFRLNRLPHEDLICSLLGVLGTANLDRVNRSLSVREWSIGLPGSGAAPASTWRRISA